VRTVVATAQVGDDDESWEERRKVWDDPRTLIGGRARVPLAVSQSRIRP
jgi:hypothetical protein